MIAHLDDTAIDALLHSGSIARIAYIDRRGRPNIAPIAYAYDGRSLFGYSLLGSKIDAMSAQPYVCIEVEHVRDGATWETVVAHGFFEPLTGQEAVDALTRIAERQRTVTLGNGAQAQAALSYVERVGGPGIVYRIRISDRHGRSSVARTTEHAPA